MHVDVPLHFICSLVSYNNLRIQHQFLLYTSSQRYKPSFCSYMELSWNHVACSSVYGTMVWSVYFCARSKFRVSLKYNNNNLFEFSHFFQYTSPHRLFYLTFLYVSYYTFVVHNLIKWTSLSFTSILLCTHCNTFSTSIACDRSSIVIYLFHVAFLFLLVWITFEVDILRL